jgi:hypothetical protein
MLISVQHAGALKVLLGVFAISWVLLRIWHIIFIHRNLVFNRNLRRDCEKRLQFFGLLATASRRCSRAGTEENLPFPRHSALNLLWGLIIV